MLAPPMPLPLFRCVLGGRGIFFVSANASNGLRRTNADKRRSVEIALQEFGDLSSRAIAELCGVNPQTVINIRPEVSNLDSSPRTGLDGKQRPARMPKRPTEFKTPPSTFDQPASGRSSIAQADV